MELVGSEMKLKELRLEVEELINERNRYREIKKAEKNPVLKKLYRELSDTISPEITAIYKQIDAIKAIEEATNEQKTC